VGGRGVGRLRPEAVNSRIALLLIAALCAGKTSSAQEPDIRVNVRLVRSLVTVKDANGALIGSLNKNDFTVFDNGVQQDIAVFERQTEQPLSIALMLDTSASVGIELRYELDSAAKFLKALVGEGNPEDAAALYTFDWQTTLLRSYTRRYTLLEQALGKVRTTGGTSMYDAIYLVSRELQDRNGRHVIVIVTDGGDTTSSKDFHEALESAQRADAVMYPIVVVPISNAAGRNVGGEHALSTLAAGTGGRIFRPSSAAELDTAFADILRELRTQYLVGYYPRDVPPTKDRYHILKVAVANRNLRVITRSGYYGDSDAPRGFRRQ
jgi:Ca-activated chloride channel homolog